MDSTQIAFNFERCPSQQTDSRGKNFYIFIQSFLNHTNQSCPCGISQKNSFYLNFLPKSNLFHNDLKFAKIILSLSIFITSKYIVPIKSFFQVLPSPSASSKFGSSKLKFFKHAQFFLYTQNHFGILKSQISLHKFAHLSIPKLF